MCKFRCCCDNFENRLSEIGVKGFSLLATKIANQYCFVLQARSQDIDKKEGTLSVIQTTIHFCPFCGTKLSEVINKNKNEFLDLIILHEDFVI